MKKTTIAYHLTNKVLLNEIFFNWKNFNQKLSEGPNVMQEELCNLWNKTKEKLKENKELDIIDLEKNISNEDFQITMNVTKNNIIIFYFTFPDADEAMAQCKCVALALTPNIPRYFTMEYFSGYFPTKVGEAFVFGEWKIDTNSNKFVHCNYGTLNKPTIPYFSGKVFDKIENN